jgi:hypothetical protein
MALVSRMMDGSISYELKNQLEPVLSGSGIQRAHQNATSGDTTDQLADDVLEALTSYDCRYGWCWIQCRAMSTRRQIQTSRCFCA